MFVNWSVLKLMIDSKYHFNSKSISDKIFWKKTSTVLPCPLMHCTLNQNSGF
ncbi:hypothetical protein BpHYR1_051659 [Brachionus plicatilis]|uniref:Uncharacterized protein n=1 Tax=Brachionus plicatilis TaxID=10195 RepID=A0A3M7PE07_BRAPC|nr:hypothetical protein BpHYR1_051659 [Brachionus plicatilis]